MRAFRRLLSRACGMALPWPSSSRARNSRCHSRTRLGTRGRRQHPLALQTQAPPSCKRLVGYSSALQLPHRRKRWQQQLRCFFPPRPSRSLGTLRRGRRPSRPLGTLLIGSESSRPLVTLLIGNRVSRRHGDPHQDLRQLPCQHFQSASRERWHISNRAPRISF